MRRGLPLRALLFGANALALLLPVVALGGLRIYDVYLLRQTERQLIAQAVVIGEAWRDAAAERHGVRAPPAVEVRPPERIGRTFAPYEPRIDLGTAILPPQPPLDPCAETPTSEVAAAAHALEPLLRRAQVFNLTAVRLIDAHGCVVGSTRSELGMSLASLPEVQAALSGTYAAVARTRFSTSPEPPLNDIQRRGKVRIFAALPVFENGALWGVVRISRTSLSALESLWLNRRGLLFGGLASAALLVVISLLFGRTLERPLRRLQVEAEAVLRGKARGEFVLSPWTPAELRALAAALREMTARLHARAEYVARYATNITHELKSPITAIRGAAELLRDGSDAMPSAQRARFLANIEADAVRMQKLVTRLLELARIENPQDEREEAIATRPFFEALAGRYGDRLSVALGELPERISIAPDRLESAVTNLVDNAFEHGGEGSVTLQASRTSEGRLEVQVTDHGPGIAPSQQEQVFERFFTTRRDEGGTGLGLALVRAIAEARGGSATVRSRPGETTFTLVL